MMPLTKGIGLNLGYSCNAKCWFCSYRNSIEARVKDRDLSTNEAKKLLRYYRKKGLEVVEFTGGEPAIRRDLVKLVAYAKELGFESVSMISNGIALAKQKRVALLVEAGIDDFLLSIHGANREIHEVMTRVPGSFDKAVQAILNVKRLGVKCRTNTAITGVNYQSVPSIADLLADLGVHTASFILFNPIIEAGNSDREMNVAYSQAAPKLKAVIDKHHSRFHKLTVRYIPFCLMEGYEPYVTSMAQIPYDPDEWNCLLRTQVGKGRLVSALGLAVGITLLPSYTRAVEAGWHVTKHDGMRKFQAFKNKVKGPQCSQCRYDMICDGVWKNYAKWGGLEELRPVRGTKIADPAYFLAHNVVSNVLGTSNYVGGGSRISCGMAPTASF